jgi:hypothetical protein
MALTTGKTVEMMMGSFIETHEKQDQLLPLTNFHEPDGGVMQDAGNTMWRKVQQSAPIIEGWDLSDEETGIIEETYPALLGTPKNDLVQMRADDMRTTEYWERRAAQSGKRQASELNQSIAEDIVTQGTLFYR